MTRITQFRFWLWLIRIIGVIVPRRLRADWKQEWVAELRHRELLLVDWDKLNWKTKLDLFVRSLGALRRANAAQAQRIHAGRGAFTGAGHRREYGVVQHGGCSAAQNLAGR